MDERRAGGALLRFFGAAGALKSEPRRGWRKRLKTVESVADHSYRTALIAMVYGDLRGLDSARAVKMALLHDLPESIVGDAIPGELEKDEKHALESAAMTKLLRGLPRELEEEYRGLWEDLVSGRSPEARLVKAADKLELGLQALEYSRRGVDTRDFFETARNGLVGEGAMLGLLQRGGLRTRISDGRGVSMP